MQTWLNYGNGLRLELNDGDAATPAIVSLRVKGKRFTATYDCACDTGYLDDTIALSDAEIAWLRDHETEVVETFERARKDHPEYQ